MAEEVKYDQHYAASPKACGEPFEAFTAFAQRLEGRARVLDLGCGQGRDAVVFAKLGHEVHGVDLSAVGVQQLRALAEREGLPITAHVCDIEEFEPEQDGFDVVLLDRVLHMLADDTARLGVLHRSVRAVRPGGHLLLSEYPKQQAMLQAFINGLEGWSTVLQRKGFLFLKRRCVSPPPTA